MVEQPPQPLDEAPRALDPRFAPRQVALGRAVGEHEPAYRVGAVLVDDRPRIDGVLLRFGHLLDAADLHFEITPDRENFPIATLYLTWRRSEARRVGKECVSTFRSRVCPYH